MPGARSFRQASGFIETFIEYPPSQRPASFSIDQVGKRVDEKIDEHFRRQEKQAKP